MRWGLVVVAVAHGLIHFMGPVKAFGLADLPQLTQPISRGLGVAWLMAGLLMLLTGAALAAGARSWWLVALGAVALSQAVIASSWVDAKYGTIANVILLAGVVAGFVARARP